MATTQVALFESVKLLPLAQELAVGAALSDLQSQMNAFLATLNPLDVLDVRVDSTSVGKYGMSVMYHGHITYRQR